MPSFSSKTTQPRAVERIIDADAEQTKHAEIKPRAIRDIITA